MPKDKDLQVRKIAMLYHKIKAEGMWRSGHTERLVLGIVYLILSLSMRKIGTPVVLAAGERGKMMMNRGWGHVARTRSVIEMMAPSENSYRLTVFGLRRVACLPAYFTPQLFKFVTNFYPYVCPITLSQIVFWFTASGSSKLK